MSLHHLAYIVVSCTFTVEAIRSDYGYDLSVFTFDNAGQYESGNMFVQLKATDKIKVDPKAHAIKFRIDKRDIMTWENEPFPVYLVVFDATRGKSHAIYLQRYFAEAGISSATMKTASVMVLLPDTEVDEATVRGWRDDKNKILGQMGAMTHA